MIRSTTCTSRIQGTARMNPLSCPRCAVFWRTTLGTQCVSLTETVCPEGVSTHTTAVLYILYWYYTLYTHPSTVHSHTMSISPKDTEWTDTSRSTHPSFVHHHTFFSSSLSQLSQMTLWVLWRAAGASWWSLGQGMAHRVPMLCWSWRLALTTWRWAATCGWFLSSTSQSGVRSG